MDREFSRDISIYKRAAAKGFTKMELLYGVVTLAVGAAQIYLFTNMGIHILIATYLAMPVTICIGFFGFYRKKGYTLLGLMMKNKELSKTSGAMPYRSDEESRILMYVEEESGKGGNHEKKERK